MCVYIYINTYIYIYIYIYVHINTHTYIDGRIFSKSRRLASSHRCALLAPNISTRV